jgi:tetratricopeptide (TPR) repeat protein
MKTQTNKINKKTRKEKINKIKVKIANGKEQFLNGNYDEAEEILTLARGKAFGLMSEYLPDNNDEWLDIMEEAVMALYEFYLDAGNKYFDEDDIKNAMDYANRAIDSHPLNTRAYHLRSDLLKQLGEFDEAIQDLKTVFSLDSEPWRVYVKLAQIYILKMSKNTAMEMVDNALKLKPDYHEASYTRALIKSIMGDFDGALPDVEEALKMEPQDPEYVSLREMVIKIKNK